MTWLQILVGVWMVLCVAALWLSTYVFDEEERKKWHDDE